MSCVLSGQLSAQAAAIATSKLVAQVLCLTRSDSTKAALLINYGATGSTPTPLLMGFWVCLPVKQLMSMHISLDGPLSEHAA